MAPNIEDKPDNIEETIQDIPVHLLPTHLTHTESVGTSKPKRGRPAKSAASKQKTTPAIIKLFKLLKSKNGFADLIKDDKVTINEVVERLGGSRSTVAKMVKSVKDGGYDQWLKGQA